MNFELQVSDISSRNSFNPRARGEEEKETSKAKCNLCVLQKSSPNALSRLWSLSIQIPSNLVRIKWVVKDLRFLPEDVIVKGDKIKFMINVRMMINDH